MKQTLLRIGLPSGTLLYASRFRELVARLPNVPAMLFHRAEDGRTLPGAPGVRFVGGRQWVGILADPGYEWLVYDFMGAAVRAVTQYISKAVPVSVEEHELDVRSCQWPVRYWIRDMAIKRRTDVRRKISTHDLVADLLLRDIEAQAGRFGLDVPTRDQLDLFVEVLSEKGLRLQTTVGVTNEFVHLVNASFDIHAELRGLWFAGNLTSRGYGRIGRDLARLAVHAPLEERQPRKVVA